ncbi:MAG: PAS domain S-box protein [Chlorobiaceae bacterium]|nr:PAS domain S-box protein [Chlorobiaceae bacterium]
MTPNHDRAPTRSAALKIATVYAFVGALWILSSGWLLHHFVHDEVLAATLENVKGWFYVLVTAMLLGLWLNRYFSQIRKTTELLQKSETRFATIFKDSPIAIVISRLRDGVFVDVNEAFTQLNGYSREENIGRSAEQLRLWHSGHRAPVIAELREKASVVVTEQVRRKNGDVRDLYAYLQLIELDGEPCILGTMVDITDRKKAEAALRESEERLQLFIDHAPAALAMFDRDMHYIAVSHRWLADFGLVGREILGRSHYEIFPEIGEELKQIHRRGQAGETLRVDEDHFERADGSVHHLRWEMHPWRDSCGAIGGIVIFTENVTDRKRAEMALRESEERFRSLIEGAPEAVFVQCAGTFRYVNQAMVKLMKAARAEELLGHSFFERILPEYHEVVRERIHDQRETGAAAPLMEQEYLCLDGTAIPVETTAVTIRFQGQDGHLVFVRDITGRREAERERKILEAQLQQAQKMESVGRLAGGVAHDFNNLLMGIMGYTELCQHELESENPACAYLDEIMDAAERSAGITRQLLAFASKQAIVPVLVDLNEQIKATLKLLRQLVGEEIELVWKPQAQDARVKMDPSQVDQILANLAVNARDAIAGVGKLTVETGNVFFDATYCAEHEGATPGDYVMLEVSDSGCGIDRETMVHIFEPFFTTKPAGKGTGLGLATIYGIVKQNHGYVNVCSEPGKGTTFRLYFPHHAQESGKVTGTGDTRELPGGTETILLVEDDKNVRLTTGLLLQSLGYNVLSAAAPDDALRQAAGHSGVIHLLITDVVMPGMNGRDLAARLSGMQPELACLYVSGYTADVIAHHGILDEGIPFLAKPFARDALAKKVHEVLLGRKSEEKR